MIYKVTINDKLYEVEVEEGKANLLNTETIQAVAAEPPVQKVSEPVEVQESAVVSKSTGDGVYTAPMPGIVLEIKVTKDQKVKEGDLLLILEAMKMENEVFAKKDGTVAEIYAVKGNQVNNGDPLLLIV